MATFISNIESFFKKGTILSNLIAVNVIIFLVIKIIWIGLTLFNVPSNFPVNILSLPADLGQWLFMPWTIVTYMFTHTGFWHILFNLLWLYWFGELFLRFFGPRSLGGLYFLGGIAGGLLFLVAYNIFPYFNTVLISSYLVGASASIMAIVFAVSFYKPNYEIGLLFIGKVKILYLAIVLLIINILTLQTTNLQGQTILNNAGGFFAHVGGILTGILFASRYKKGKDITKGLTSFFDGLANFFKKRSNGKKRQAKMKVHYSRNVSDMEYNARKNQENQEIDIILEKIKRSGYNSLTENEKKKLFNASKK
jgi:membrane associated rhomboid family serine protease